MRSNGLKLTLCGAALCAATSAVGLVAQTTPTPLPPSSLSSRMLANDEERGRCRLRYGNNFPAAENAGAVGAGS